MNKCPRCESEILKEYNYCPICGALLDYEVKDATVEVLKSMRANYIELECKDSEDEKGRKLAIGTLGIAITELERTAQVVSVQEIIENQIEKLIDIQEENKNFHHNNGIATCLAVSAQINELLKTYLEIKKNTITK